jgi:hypothetical protein
MKLMNISAVFALGLTSLALADNAKVELSSFVMAGARTRAAEICGRVAGGAKTAPTFIRITVDEKSAKPGVYNVVAGPDGAFCVAVVSYYGSAVAALWEVNAGETNGASITLQPSSER